jgi:uncharacterized protein (TIGR02996 family)
MTAMTEAEMFAAIRVAPDDDGPRLIYADWLVEQGDPRGELIQLDCRMETLERSSPERLEAERLRNGLVTQHAREWIEPLLELGIHRATIRRGFVECLVVHGQLTHRLAEIRALAPFAREVQVEDETTLDAFIDEGGFDGFSLHASMVPRLARVPRLRSLVVRGLEARDLERVLELPGLAHVRRLALFRELPYEMGREKQRSYFIGQPSFPAQLLRRFADVLDGMKALRELELLGFAPSRWPAWIERVTIRDTRLEKIFVGASLTELRLEGCAIGDAGVRALVASPAPRLRSLALPHNQIGAAGLRALARWKAPLAGIDLAGNLLDDGAIAAAMARPRPLITQPDRARRRVPVAIAAVVALIAAALIVWRMLAR